EIERYSIFKFVYDHYQNYDESYKIVNIHWPEAIFGWVEPSSEDLHKLEKEILKWKKGSILVYTKHDLKRHKGMTPLFTELFNLIERHTDLFLHLGNYSKELYQGKFPDVRHEIL